MLDILRRSEVMADLAAWNAGTALGDDTYGRVAASSAIGVISVRGQSLTDYARGGSAVESVWIRAQQHGLAVQPVSPAFLYAHDDEDLRELSPAFAEHLGDLQYNFRKLADTEAGESQVLVLRFSRAPRPSAPEPAARTTSSLVATRLTPIRRIRCQAAWSWSSRQSPPN